MIRPVEVRDLVDIMDLEAEAFDADRWSMEAYADYARIGRGDVYEWRGRPRAVVWHAPRGKDGWEVASLATAKRFAGRGFARGLLEGVFAAARAAGRTWVELEVRPTNHRAQALYYRLGFQVVNTLPDYYSDGSDGIVLRLGL